MQCHYINSWRCVGKSQLHKRRVPDQSTLLPKDKTAKKSKRQTRIHGFQVGKCNKYWTMVIIKIVRYHDFCWLIKILGVLHFVTYLYFYYSYDWIKIYDGPTNSSFVLRDKWCGEVAPEMIRSSSNEMLIQFVSDASQVRRGYMARVYAGK